MREASTISKVDDNPFHLDFEKLQLEFIDQLQELCGNVWTDFNAHDPGVTILEQLSYIITELSFRAGFSVQDLLSDPEGKIDERKSVLITPATILPTAPVTIKDFRKLLLDRIPQIHNVWLRPLTTPGQYTILVLPTEQYLQANPSEAQWQKLRKRAWKIFNRNRALSDQALLADVKVLRRKKLIVHSNVVVKSHQSLEKVLAEIVIGIKDYLNPAIPRRTIEEMEQLNLGPEEIFDGPKLDNGFILSADLAPKLETVNVASLIKIVIGVEDVDSVSSMQMEWADQPGIRTEEINIPEDVWVDLVYKHPMKFDTKAVQVLRNPDGGDDKSLTIRLKKFGSETYFNLDDDALRQAVHMHKARLKRSYTLDTKVSKYSAPPEGNFRQPADYYSIQNDFPSFYAINKFGVSNSQPNKTEDAAKLRKRRGEVNQLKGYLLVFEQLLANYLAQLEGLRKLFSVDEDISSSYFSQVLTDEEVPNVSPLYFSVEVEQRKHQELNEFKTKELDEQLQLLEQKRGYKLKLLGKEITSEYLIKEYKKELDKIAKTDHQAVYQKELEESVSQFDDANNRRGRFLDHLLALYGESFNQDALMRFSYLYYSKKEAEYRRNLNKIRFLQNIVRVTRNRASASSFLAKQSWVDKEPYRLLSGTEFKVRMLLGLDLPGERSNLFKSLLHVFADKGLRLVAKEEMTSDDHLYYLEKLNTTLNEIYINEHALEVDIEGLEKPSEEKQQQLLDETMLLKFNLVDDVFLRAGLRQRDYRVCIDEETEKHHILFKNPERTTEHTHWLNLGSYESYEDAAWAAVVLRAFLVTLNTQSEGLHILEHSLLRPHEGANDNAFNTPDEANHFFDHSVSVFAPNWSARFHSKAFRKLADETLVYVSPAHLAIDVFWLGPTQMLDFEEMYSQWLTDKASGKESEHLNTLRLKLIEFIKMQRLNVEQ